MDVIEATYGVVDTWNHEDTAAPWWRLYWNDRPGWVARFGGRRHALAPTRVVLIAPETNFVARSASPAGHFWVHFSVGPPLHAVRARVFELPADEVLARSVNECREALAAADSVRAGLRVPAVCALALARLEALPSVTDERTGRVLALLRETASRPGAEAPTNRELARRVSMHPNAFIRWFKRELGSTPHAFLVSRRIEQACALLRYTDLSVQEVGDRLGFCDRYHFSRTFRRWRGLSPAAFRRGCI